MLCYKDMSFCNATDCAVKDCARNIKGFNYNPPDDFWRSKTCIADMKDSCKKYKKEDGDESNKSEL